MQKEVTWYFVDLLGQRKGPVTQQQLLDAVAEGRIRSTSLVWREGLAQWQPLSVSGTPDWSCSSDLLEKYLPLQCR